MQSFAWSNSQKKNYKNKIKFRTEARFLQTDNFVNSRYWN